MIIEYVTAESPRGDIGQLYVDIPSPTGRRFVVVQSLIVNAFSANGKRDLGEVSAMVERYERGVDGGARDTAEASTAPFVIPICGKNTKTVSFSERYEPYSSVAGIAQLEGKGFRVTLTPKARNSDYQRIQVGYATLGREDTR